MAGEYEKPISIKEAILSINASDFLLPSIQRKFVWSSQQICVLFDSIMRGYPINSFMMWDVRSDEIKNNYKFYSFIKDYCQRFNEENPQVFTNASFKNFKAIIDGQQRLTSLYIGLHSTYAYKQPRTWWPSTKDDKLLPPRKLYLDLMQPLKSEDDEALMHYNFKFLTDAQYAESFVSKSHHWFCLHEILRMPEVDGSSQIWNKVIRPYLETNGLANNEFSQVTLSQLYDVIRVQKIIHYFNEPNQSPDHVLDVFIRTNSGGTKLEFSDLLMSIAVANWNGDFRKELDGLIKQIHQSVELGFYLERDWVLKTCLMLTDANVRFKVSNFQPAQVGAIQSQWGKIKECIKQTFYLVRRMGINPQSLTSKNAVIPICYYLFKKQVNNQPLYETINNLSKQHDQRSIISQWFYMVLLKGIFGSQADSILESMRNIIDKKMDSKTFPLSDIVDSYVATSKDLRFDEEYIERLLDTQHGEGRCRALLHLLFPEMNATEIFHIDHLHPQVSFSKKNLNSIDYLKNDSALMMFYSDTKHWNSIANLHLLNDSQNRSKNDSSLVDWVADKNTHITSADLLVDGVSLEFNAFKTFYEARRKALKNRLISRVFMTTSLAEPVKNGDADEEVVNELPDEEAELIVENIYD